MSSIMEPTVSETEYGAVVGRFQSHRLHQAYIDVIETVKANHKRVIIFLGISPVVGSRRNPLNFEARKLMIQEKYPEITVLGVKDVKHDKLWVSNLESTFRDYFPIGSVTLYGSRDSFVTTYKKFGGKFQTVELKQQVFVSSTDFRKEASLNVLSSEDFRAGIIYSIYNSHPKAVQTVDVAIVKDLYTSDPSLLLAGKRDEFRWRFIGGHEDPTDKSKEEVGLREGLEETGGQAILSNPRYIGSCDVDDWRYRGDRDKIHTVLISAIYEGGPIEPADDIERLRWFKFSELQADIVEEEHMPLMEMFRQSISEDARNELTAPPKSLKGFRREEYDRGGGTHH